KWPPALLPRRLFRMERIGGRMTTQRRRLPTVPFLPTRKWNLVYSPRPPFDAGERLRAVLCDKHCFFDHGGADIVAHEHRFQSEDHAGLKRPVTGRAQRWHLD